MPAARTWDIFCNVIDNYGDIGVCWRLARQLAGEYSLEVRLWVDDLASLQMLCPEISLSAEKQHCCGVEVRQWTSPFPTIAPADIVIEAFACELPESYLERMTQADRKPCWINLEYLSAETWGEGCHGLTSPHPRLPLTKHFFFPGFTAKTGGLLRERDLTARRDDLQENPVKLWRLLNLPLPIKTESVVSLFCYDNAPIHYLLDAWAEASSPVRCLLPEGKALQQVAQWFNNSAVAAGDTLQRGNLTLHILPFMRQEDYDLLLWACDCNFVRGEDSFVRAQWAAKPMIWQIYPQQENTHLLKLEAFLDAYCSNLADEAAAVVRAFHHGWNGARTDREPLPWVDFWRHRAALQAHAAAWATYLGGYADLASNLVNFLKNKV